MTSNDPADDEGRTWTADELTRDFEVLHFMSWFVAVRRRSDGTKGSLEFTDDSPRVYYGWCEDSS